MSFVGVLVEATTCSLLFSMASEVMMQPVA